LKEAEQQSRASRLFWHRRNFSWLTERISGVVEQPAPRWWWVAFAITSSAATFGLFCIGYQISTASAHGNQIPVGWAWDITNFVFWIGIGHAGTLISAILFLLRGKSHAQITATASIAPRNGDRSTPFCRKQKQNCGDECAGVSDTDPENEIGNVPGPSRRDLISPCADAVEI